MSWARMDDGYDDNPKCQAAGKDGRALDQTGMRHCAKHLTDGVIADHDLPVLAAKAGVRLKPTLRRLIEVGRWHAHDHDCERCVERVDCPPGHHVVHDYLDFNPPGEKERAKRLARAEAGRKGGQRSRPPTKTEANSEAIASANAQANGEANQNPVPVPPGTYISPPTNGGTRPELDGRIIDQGVQLAATRYASTQADQGRSSSPDGLARWWLQENAAGARIRAAQLIDDFDLTVTQLADALLTPQPRLEAFRRRNGDVMHDMHHGQPPDPAALERVHEMTAGLHTRLPKRARGAR